MVVFTILKYATCYLAVSLGVGVLVGTLLRKLSAGDTVSLEDFNDLADGGMLPEAD